MKLQIVWFRTDLRVQDNRALQHALENTGTHGPVVGLYIATPEQWQRHDDAPVKLDFWRRSLECLEDSLHSLNIPLVCLEVPLWADIADAMAVLADAVEISALNFNIEYPLNELRRDEAVISLCEKSGMEVTACHDRLLTEPAGVLTGGGEAYKVFSPYARKVREIMPAFRFRKPRPQQGKPALSLPARLKISDLGWPRVDESLHSQWQRMWPAGEDLALKQLRAFCSELVSDYKKQRDFPGIEGTSRLSPHLAAGTLSARQCWAAASIAGDGDGVECWRNELIWRDFYHYVMFHFPHVCMGRNWRDDVDFVTWNSDEEGFRAWCEGRTGIPIVDAAMRQLRQTGWMHNRLRMVSAMFLSKNLLIDWRRGEQWFMQHLIDGDFAANNGGWQWSASTGTDAAPYFRVFNPVSQSQRFDPDGEFIRHYVPELSALDARAIHDPGLLRPAGYPAPIVDLKSSRQRAIDAFRKP